MQPLTIGFVFEDKSIKIPWLVYVSVMKEEVSIQQVYYNYGDNGYIAFSQGGYFLCGEGKLRDFLTNAFSRT